MASDSVLLCCLQVLLGLGILGNTFVIISIARHRGMLKNNYYFLVLHLTLCDLSTLVISLLQQVISQFEHLRHVYIHPVFCHFKSLGYLFVVAGIGMMLIISALRYRATIHPLEPAIGRRKLKVVSFLMYFLGFIAGYGPAIPFCLSSFEQIENFYNQFYTAYLIFCYSVLPTSFMVVVYYKIFRELIEQSEFMKSLCSHAVRKATPNSAFNKSWFIRNRRTCFVCLTTVLCYAVGHIPISVWYALRALGSGHCLKKHAWFLPLSRLFRNAGSHAVNPLIYGILDKKFLLLWKLCSRKKRKPQEFKDVFWKLAHL